MNHAKGQVEVAADPSGYSFLMTFFRGRAVHPRVNRALAEEFLLPALAAIMRHFLPSQLPN